LAWFEGLTGISPDGGSGAFESTLAALLGVAIIGVAAYMTSRRRKTAR
jgi:LPXTG-motif cell wall-anchored protein